MIDKLKQFIIDLLTARNGTDYSLTKIMGIFAGITMIIRFWQLPTPDFQGFAIGMAAIMGALAAKYYVETPAEKPTNDA
jgi:hypothetical protein